VRAALADLAPQLRQVAGEPAPPATVADVVAAYRRWLHLPDLTPLLAVLGAVAANRLEGDPVWLLVVGPPGGGKSELLGGLTQLPDVHPAATLTEAALLSGTPKKESQGARGGLLRVIGDFGLIVCKDFGSVLSMHRDARAAVLAALREVFDGSWTRHVGTDGGRTLHWSGKVGLIAGCTPTIDRHHAVMGAMGERFILVRLPEADGSEQARRALAHAGKERAMRAELSEAVAGLFSTTGHATLQPLTDEETDQLVSLSSLIVRCRSAVERDGYSREVELIPDPEAPTRLIVVLERLFSGLLTIGVDRPTAWQVVGSAALDSMPALRRSVLGCLHGQDELPTSQVAEGVGYPRSTTERALEDLVAHGIADAHRHGQGKATTWSLTRWAALRYAAATSPETSAPTNPATSPETSAEALKDPDTTFDDFSGEVVR